MSHFTVLVIGENPEEQLAPFQENNMGDCPKEFMEFQEDEDSELDEETGKRGYWENPNRKWDWYSLGGRWTGFFKVKEGASASIGSPGIMTAPAEPGHGDQLLKGDIDFEVMRNEAGLEAQNRYEFAEKVLDGAQPMESWESVRERIKDIDEARKFYHAQECVVRFRSKEVVDVLGWHADPSDYSTTKQEYIERARNGAGRPFAVVKDGKWYEKGSMGWWGMVSNENSEWARQYAELIDSIPDDTLLSLYDCHI